MYLTQSTLKAQLLSKEMGKQSVDSQIANMALRLDVPVLEKLGIYDENDRVRCVYIGFR